MQSIEEEEQRKPLIADGMRKRFLPQIFVVAFIAIFASSINFLLAGMQQETTLPVTSLQELIDSYGDYSPQVCQEYGCTSAPTTSPTDSPSRSPTVSPTLNPTQSPTPAPTSTPPTPFPTISPTNFPTEEPTTSQPVPSPTFPFTLP